MHSLIRQATSCWADAIHRSAVNREQPTTPSFCHSQHTTLHSVLCVMALSVSTGIFLYVTVRTRRSVYREQCFYECLPSSYLVCKAHGPCKPIPQPWCPRNLQGGWTLQAAQSRSPDGTRERPAARFLGRPLPSAYQAVSIQSLRSGCAECQSHIQSLPALHRLGHKYSVNIATRLEAAT